MHVLGMESDKKLFGAVLQPMMFIAPLPPPPPPPQAHVQVAKKLKKVAIVKRCYVEDYE
jgi:hypothetical protein